MESFFGTIEAKSRPRHVEDARKRGDREALRRMGKRGGETTAARRRREADKQEADRIRREEEMEEMRRQRNGDPDN